MARIAARSLETCLAHAENLPPGEARARASDDGHGFVGDARESTRIPPELVGVHDFFFVVAVVRRREVLLEHRDVEPLLLVRARRTRR